LVQWFAVGCNFIWWFVPFGRGRNHFGHHSKTTHISRGDRENRSSRAGTNASGRSGYTRTLGKFIIYLRHSCVSSLSFRTVIRDFLMRILKQKILCTWPSILLLLIFRSDSLRPSYQNNEPCVASRE
jgi:hypothetical protein